MRVRVCGGGGGGGVGLNDCYVIKTVKRGGNFIGRPRYALTVLPGEKCTQLVTTFKYFLY